MERVRLKDSFMHVWWLARSSTPRADNSRVLTPYSEEMKALLRRKKYNAGRRPFGHYVSKMRFLKNHGGAVSPNAIDLSEAVQPPSAVLRFSNTAWGANYVEYCRRQALESHTVRMSARLAPSLDPLAGSNTTGAIAEQLARRWLAVEAHEPYAERSRGRFESLRSDVIERSR